MPDQGSSKSKTAAGVAGLGLGGKNIVQVLCKVLWSPKHVQNVKGRLGHVCYLPKTHRQVISGLSTGVILAEEVQGQGSKAG